MLAMQYNAIIWSTLSLSRVAQDTTSQEILSYDITATI